MRLFPVLRRAAAAAAAALCATAPAAWGTHSDFELLTTGPAPSGAPADATLEWVSEDAATILFATEESLVAEDGDTALDVYRRSGTTTTLMSGGTAADVGFAAASADGSAIVYTTDEPLSAADGDDSYDVYRHDGATLTLLSDVDDDSSDPDVNAFVVAASTTLDRVFFYTPQPLDPAVDGESNHIDVYVHQAGTVTLVTRSNATSDDVAYHEQDAWISADGTRAFWLSSRKYDTVNDADTYGDVYMRSGGTTTMLTDRVQAGDDADEHAGLLAVSTDGTRMLFETEEPITGADQNMVNDLYLWTEGTGVQLVTSGTDGEASDFAAVTPALDAVAFETSEALTSDDDDTDRDLFVKTLGGTPATTLVSRTTSGAPGDDAGPIEGIEGASEDFTRFFFTTTEAMVDADDDGGMPDIYERVGTTTSLVTAGPAATDHPDFYANVSAVAPDGTLALETDYPLTADDANGTDDVFVRRDGVLSLVAATDEATFFGALSGDGSRLVFTTGASLLPADGDTLLHDAYVATEATHDSGSGPDDGDDGGDDAGDGGGGTPPPGPLTTPPVTTPGPGPLPPAAPRDITRPALSVSGSRTQRPRRGVRVRVRSDEAASVSARVTVRIGARTVRSRRARATLGAGRATTIVLRFSRADLRRLARALGGRRLPARVSVTATDAAGNATTRTLTLRLRR
jgi:hypothetical protein